MSAPHFVPASPIADVRSYASPPRRNRSWTSDRPGDLGGEGQPDGPRLGTPGPDQGYAYKLIGQFAGKVFTAEGERDDDVVAGVIAVAMKRSAVFGRAPVIHDLRVAFAVWGFLDDRPATELVQLRTRMFEEISNPHHYRELRAVADAVPESTLRLTPDAAMAKHTTDWRSLLELDGSPAAH